MKPKSDLQPTDQFGTPTDFEKAVQHRLSRRDVLKGGLSLGVASLLLGPGRSAKAFDHLGLSFQPVAANTLDTVTVPPGFHWQVVAKWGQPLWSDATRFEPESGAWQERAFGDNNDGMALQEIDGHHVLAVNHEYINFETIFANRASKKAETADDIRKGKAGHGLSIVEIAERDGQWSIVLDSPFNRRITVDTPMEITGPARGHDWMKTAADPSGTRSLGTWANCSNGHTPWGTYLTCEENFDGYFSSRTPDADPGPALKRYGIGGRGWGYKWEETDPRFDFAVTPNEANRVGYVVEIDPSDPTSTPRKRTALGRFKHENAELVVAADGHVVVYMADDERGEFLYRFISDQAYRPGQDNSSVLEDGRLFAAKFHDDGRGEWLELTPAATGMASKAEVCIHTRQAASAVGATTMDRPERIAVHPLNGAVYCALTNNKDRGEKANLGGDAMPVGGPNPRAKNKYGQIVRWSPTGGDHRQTTFQWDLFALAGNPTVHSDANGGSGNINAANMFNGPDGLAIDSKGRLWIQTDGNRSDKDDFSGMGNNQMLVADPDSGEIQRFLVAPGGSEVTGITWSGDRKTLFIGIQHPGERTDSHFPDGGDSLPRSSVIAIRRDDGGEIG